MLEVCGLNSAPLTQNHMWPKNYGTKGDPCAALSYPVPAQTRLFMVNSCSSTSGSREDVCLLQGEKQPLPFTDVRCFLQYLLGAHVLGLHGVGGGVEALQDAWAPGCCGVGAGADHLRGEYAGGSHAYTTIPTNLPLQKPQPHPPIYTITNPTNTALIHTPIPSPPCTPPQTSAFLCGEPHSLLLTHTQPHTCTHHPHVHPTLPDTPSTTLPLHTPRDAIPTHIYPHTLPRTLHPHIHTPPKALPKPHVHSPVPTHTPPQPHNIQM